MQLQQQYSIQALHHVQQILGQPARTRSVYGSLCHNLPILVRQSGLCQTVAFLQEKGTGPGDRQDAYRAIHRQIAEIIGVPEGQLLASVQQASVGTTIWYTRQLLAAWIYYKRFAVSILEILPGMDVDTEG